MRIIAVLLLSLVAASASATELDDLWAELNANVNNYDAFSFVQNGITYIGISWGSEIIIDDYYEFNAAGEELYFGFLGVPYSGWDYMRMNFGQGRCATFIVCDDQEFWPLAP
ncbi:MAG: hypothetical protein AAFR91_10940 [Pseudomonadota bacterium]